MAPGRRAGPRHRVNKSQSRVQSMRWRRLAGMRCAHRLSRRRPPCRRCGQLHWPQPVAGPPKHFVHRHSAGDRYAEEPSSFSIWFDKRIDGNSVKLFSERRFTIPRTGCLFPPPSFDRPFSPSIEIVTNLDVHFDGPKMDETSEATHAVKGLWLSEKDLTLARAPLKLIQLARRGRAQTGSISVVARGRGSGRSFSEGRS